MDYQAHIRATWHQVGKNRYGRKGGNATGRGLASTCALTPGTRAVICAGVGMGRALRAVGLRSTCSYYRARALVGLWPVVAGLERY